ncbi:hypothetical protein BSL78_21914 [Apostichopus japonicus]|uniref:Ras-GEF domain-containing protein n=1 Tax=Stichopus japonicus TaxID=307972 RepID=A0A2G8JZP7_STIJA|nr:hypothetical protein BSL78_21914 [Apostichopus japonicus]
MFGGALTQVIASLHSPPPFNSIDVDRCSLLKPKVLRKTHLLHISESHISLLQADSKSPVERHPLTLVEDWHVTFEREAGGYPTLVVIFGDNVGGCWRLLISTPQQVKQICTTLSSVMEEVQNNNNDGVPGGSTTPADTPTKDPVSKSKRQKFAAQRDKSISKSVQSTLSITVPEDRELVLCSHYLRFPVEASSILTNAEFKLFQDVRSSCYVNYIRNNGLMSPSTEQDRDVKTIHDLKDRCEKVTEWVVETVLEVPEEQRFPLLHQFVELANTCWNMGNFQAVVEILEALLSDQLKSVLDQAESGDISSLMQLHQAIVEGEADYQDALDKSLRIPGCKVVPYFGVFLDQLVSVWEEPSPALSMSMLEMEREITEWGWWTKDGDMPTASPGLLSTEKMSHAYWILEDLRFCQRLARQNASLEESENTESLPVPPTVFEQEDLAYHSCSEDFEDAESIEPLPKTHGLEIVPQQCMDANLNALHCMLRGTRVFRVDEEGSKYSECFLRLDESNAVLIWTKVQQKDLPLGSLSASLSILSNKYSTSTYIVGGLEEGFLDLTHAKELLSEADELDCTHISHSTDYELSPFGMLYGTSIIDNKLLYFLAPKNTCAIWKAGLGPIIRAIQMQQRALSDKRTKWLMKQFLNAFFFKGNLEDQQP